VICIQAVKASEKLRFRIHVPGVDPTPHSSVDIVAKGPLDTVTVTHNIQPFVVIEAGYIRIECVFEDSSVFVGQLGVVPRKEYEKQNWN
jgi:hypothetical protein